MSIWLEMSRDEDHGGFGWAFTECLWAPTHKNPSGNWPFWQLLLNIKEGDLVVHLRGKTHSAKFVGYSIADARGYQTSERPPLAKQWDYANSFYRVPLRDFVQFIDPISLDDVFKYQEVELKKYFLANKALPQFSREHIFYVLQSQRLQCLNGAYVSQLNERLAAILFGSDFTGSSAQSRIPTITVPTGQQISEARVRLGQQEFADRIKASYKYRCCFPDCDVAERELLIGAHIARWADAPSLRGDLANGLCFCPIHDRAFEVGYFTLTQEYQIYANISKIKKSSWAQKHIVPYNGETIRLGEVKPEIRAIKNHWDRIGVSPEYGNISEGFN